MLDLGNVRIHWLDGGAFRVDGGAMFGPVPKTAWAERYPCDERNLIPLEARALLVETESEWVVVDSGFGHHLSERQRRIYHLERPGALEDSLSQVGISAEQVSWVVLTHLHLDHASGLVRPSDQGALVPLFPRARHAAQRREVEDMAQPHERERHAYEQASWQPLAEQGLVEIVDGAREIVPGLDVFLTGGHSRGHQGVRVRGERASAIHLGDVLPTSVHLRPLWVSALDDYPLESIEVKREWLGQAAANGWWVSFSHDHQVLAGHCTPEYKLADPITEQSAP